jgi:hypothetical protein
MTPYRKRLNISCDTGSETLLFYSKHGMFLACGYTRVVIGGRGPFVEFLKRQIRWENFSIPADEIYRATDPSVFYLEYRSACEGYVKMYLQKRTVAYADYKVDRCYLSPNDLQLANGLPVINA